MIWPSELFIYGFMIVNVCVVGFFLLRAWRKGLLDGDCNEILFPVEDEDEERRNGHGQR